MRRLVAFIQRMATHYGIDLDAAIAAKMEFNRTRSLPARREGAVSDRTDGWLMPARIARTMGAMGLPVTSHRVV